jgi:hypothetical protein
MALPDAWWPWLAVAGLGALHGLSPANGWLFAAAQATRSGDARDVQRALLPIGAGHALSVALVVVLVMQGVWLAPQRMQIVAGGCLLALAAWRLVRRARITTSPTSQVVRRSHVDLAVWSCLTGTAHGSGFMLVPALVPLCMAEAPARAITATGSLLLMLVAVGLHLLAMLATIQLFAAGVCRGAWWHRACASDTAWAGALALAGAIMIAQR